MKQRFGLHMQHMRAKPKLSRVPMPFYTRKVGLVNKKKNIRRHCRAFNCILILCMVYSCCTFFVTLKM